MSSSDSDDDCYGNIASKLQKLKNNYEDVKLEDSLDNSNVIDIDNSKEIDEIIKNAAKPEKKTGRKRGKKSQNPAEPNGALIPNDSENPTSPKRKRTTRAAAKAAKTAAEIEPAPVNPPVPDAADVLNTGNSSRDKSTPRARGRGRQRGNGRNKRRTPRRGWFPNFLMNRPENGLDVLGPIYSVGNTYEYPDQSENQELFSAKPKVDDVVEIIEDNDVLEENEELSVKVYWQSSEFFKFKIRKFQKITQIFDYFSHKENVSNENLFFTYNDKILKPEDTPEAISYNIGKFIDGGIVNKSVTHLIVQNDDTQEKSGLKIKFQCQNSKKPFETYVGLYEKLSLAMTKCAEHLECPLSTLKFEFDGDIVLPKHTPGDLEFEGEECIDVKILS